MACDQRCNVMKTKMFPAKSRLGTNQFVDAKHLGSGPINLRHFVWQGGYEY